QAMADVFRNELVKGIPGPKLQVNLPNAFGFGGFGAQAIQFAVRGSNPDVVHRLADQVTTIAKTTPGAVDVNNSNENVQPEEVIYVNRDRAADVGITAQAAATALNAAVDGIKVTKFRRPLQDDVDVRL